MAAKANATLPPQKGIEAPPAPPVIRVSESSCSSSSDEEVVAEKVMTEETELGSFPEEMGLLESESGALSPAEGMCLWRAGKGAALV